MCRCTSIAVGDLPEALGTVLDAAVQASEMEAAFGS